MHWVEQRKNFEKSIFEKIASQITTLKSGKNVCDSFKVLCNEQKADSLIGTIKGLQLNEAQFVDNKCDWWAAKNCHGLSVG